MCKYAIGLDFGTLSGRAVLVNIKNGEEVATAVMEYPHGVIQTSLPGLDVSLGDDWALQDPRDYLDVTKRIIPEVIEKSGVRPQDIIGIGIDFTACTILPVDKDGNPLCFSDKFRANPHSWVKLWKHHAAQYEANKFNDAAKSRNEQFLNLYGGKVSSEWLFPKLMQIVDESPDIYENAHAFIEAGDWMVMQITGNLTRNCCAAGFKASWNYDLGYPSREFLKTLHPKLENVVEDKLSGEVYPIGKRAGFISPEFSKATGLLPTTSVSVASIDAHVALPAMGVSSPGKMVLIIGTSTCNIIVSDKEYHVPGISGVVKDGVIPGFYGYEAGQAAVGDIFDWFIKTCVPKSYYDEAERRSIDIFELLTEKASRLMPGESGLLCLDWLNGNRSTLNDADLQGMILGLTLGTKPEEIYRSLIEATAFGQRLIMETFRENGVDVGELYACGGISLKNILLMQIYSDVMNMTIKISASTQVVALGSAIFGAVAAGGENGGYDTVEEATRAMSRLLDKQYVPNQAHAKTYDKIYNEYKKLYNYFGKENNVMKTLKNIKSNS